MSDFYSFYKEVMDEINLPEERRSEILANAYATDANSRKSASAHHGTTPKRGKVRFLRSAAAILVVCCIGLGLIAFGSVTQQSDNYFGLNIYEAYATEQEAVTIDPSLDQITWLGFSIGGGEGEDPTAPNFDTMRSKCSYRFDLGGSGSNVDRVDYELKGVDALDASAPTGRAGFSTSTSPKGQAWFEIQDADHSAADPDVTTSFSVECDNGKDVEANRVIALSRLLTDDEKSLARSVYSGKGQTTEEELASALIESNLSALSDVRIVVTVHFNDGTSVKRTYQVIAKVSSENSENTGILDNPIDFTVEEV